MNILTDILPDSVSIAGRAWHINTEFFVGVEFELLMQDDKLTYEEKARQALTLYYPEIPPDLNAAVERLLWFYRCGTENALGDKGEKEDSKTVKKSTPAKKAYCFEQDADLIYAAFLGAYRIDLAESGLHWWKFRALFMGLPAESDIKKIMGYRTADIGGLSKAQKKHYAKMRKLFALKNQRTVYSAVTLEERDQRMKDYVNRRFAEVEAVPD
jgi:hypothetical protein